MKLTIVSALFLIGFTFFSCSPTSSIQSPNNLKNVNGTMFFHNGDSVSGRLSFNNEVMANRWVTIFDNEQNEKLRYHLLEVKSYKTANQLYELKQIKSKIAVGRNFHFMKRLTDHNSKFHLYEHLEKQSSPKSGLMVLYKRKYYIQFPEEKQHTVWALDSERLVPHFHLKMSEQLAACPELKEKVLNKQNGYFYSHLNASDEQRLSVLLNIVNDYNQCEEVVNTKQAQEKYYF